MTLMIEVEQETAHAAEQRIAGVGRTASLALLERPQLNRRRWAARSARQGHRACVAFAPSWHGERRTGCPTSFRS
jgi:hypothetical protein